MAEIRSESITVKRRGQDETDILKIFTEIDAPQSVTHRWIVEPCFISPCYGARLESTKLILSIEAHGGFNVRSTFCRAEQKAPANKDVATDVQQHVVQSK
jgi:hypothetical protein